MKRSHLLFGVSVLSLVLAGCPPKEGATGGSGGRGSTTGDILVGEYASLSGLQATFGQSQHNGIMLAADEINGAGGINGRKIKIVTEDDQSKQEEAANAVTKLISQDNVVAILGEIASSNSLAAGPICQSNKIPMITPGSTNPEVTKKGDYIFRVCYIDPYQGKALADFSSGILNAKKAAVLRDLRSDYSLGLSQFFMQEFKARGGQIVNESTYTNGDSDFRAQLNTIKAANPDVIFVPGYYNDVGQVAQQARDLGLKQPLVGGDGWESPKLIEIGGKALEGCYYSTHYSPEDPSPEVHNYVTNYQKRYNVKPDGLSALGYDAMKVLADAIKRAGSTDPKAIRDAIAATKGYVGVTGTISIGPDRNPVDKKLVILEIANGTTKLKAIVDPTKGPNPIAVDAAGAATSTGAATGTAATSTATSTAAPAATGTH